MVVAAAHTIFLLHLPAAPARAQVLLGRWQCSLVAVKVLKEECTQHVGSNELASLRREAEMLQALNHPNILRFFGACFTCKPVRNRCTMMLCCPLNSAVRHTCVHGLEYARWLCADGTRQRGAKACAALFLFSVPVCAVEQLILQNFSFNWHKRAVVAVHGGRRPWKRHHP